MKNKLVSIVVVALGYSEYLKRTLESLRILRGNFEIICVDTGWDLKLEEYLHSLKKISYHRSSIQKSKNKGANEGVRKAKGTYLLLLDDDIELINPDILQELIDMYESQDNTGCLSIALVNENEKKTGFHGGFIGLNYIRESSKLSLEKVKSLNGQKISFPHAASFFIRKDLWEEVGGYDESYIFGGDDSDLGMRLYMYGYINYLYSKTVQIHTGMSKRQSNEYYAKVHANKVFSNLSVILKNYSFPNVFIVFHYYLFFLLLKSIKQSFFRKDINVLFVYFKGIGRLLLNLDKILKERRDRQRSRKNKRDVFILKPRV